jgi:hypothetical protein
MRWRIRGVRTNQLSRVGVILLLAWGLMESRSVAAQSQDSMPNLTFSMGQPPRWHPYASILGSLSRSKHGFGFAVGSHRFILNPIGGLLGASGELVGNRIGGDDNFDVRAIAAVPVLGIGIGADWCLTCSEIDALVTFQTALRRGGVLGRGTTIRFDWMPSRGGMKSLGLQFPLFQPFAGKTRAPRTTASIGPARMLDRPGSMRVRLDDSVERVLEPIPEAARLIAAYSNLYSSKSREMLGASQHGRFSGRAFDAVVRMHHAALTNAFRIVLRDSARARLVGEKARATVLEHVILAFNALFGQAKEPSTPGAMLANARERFASWLRDSTDLDDASRERLRQVLGRWLDLLADLQREQFSQQRDSRFIWLPPQLALAPEEYDEQEEVDRLLGRVVGRSITGNNALTYLRTADLPLEIARSILAARRYHVLWTHDFTGRRPSGRLDQISYTMVADAYLPALTAAVQRYDSAGTIPQFLILLDAFYYHGRGGQLFMDILQDPLNAPVALRNDEAREARHLEDRLVALRSAVAQSSRLQREAAANGGASWLARLIKVHVNITLPSDFSFRSSHIVPPIPFTPDNIVRDHRKIVFYDLVDADPYEGQLLVAGTGIGEHYASATWEDRGFRVRGPGALEARDAALRTLRANGSQETRDR